MKRVRAVARARGVFAPIFKTTLACLLAIALGTGFWIASLPAGRAEQMPAPAMIESQLPHGKTIATATKTQLLDAVCKASKKWPHEAGLIVRTAAAGRKNLRGEILCTAIRCLHQDCTWTVDVLREWTKADPNEANNILCMIVRCLHENDAFDCTCLVNIVHVWIKAEPSEANRLTELVLQCAPDCHDLLEGPALSEGGFGNPPNNINPPPGSVGSGVGGNTCIVCHNGHEIQLPCSDLDSYLRRHPGDTAGQCQPTPVTNL